jgi:hypothetical protein
MDIIAKKEKLAKLVELQDSSSSDDEIQLNSVKQSLNEVEATIEMREVDTSDDAKKFLPTKPKRKLNLTDAERERRRQSMIKTREIRQNKVAERKQLEEDYMRQKEEEAQLKVIKKAEKLKKQKEKELYNQILTEKLDSSKKEKPIKKKKPVIVYREPPNDSDSSDSSSSSESEEEPEIVYKVAKKKKERSKRVEPKIEPAVIQQNVARYPAFRIAY